MRLAQDEGRSLIVAYYPPDLRTTGERFVATTALLSKAGVPVPEILDWDPDAGIMLIEDLGCHSLYSIASDADGWQRHWRSAVELIAPIEQLEPEAVNAINAPLLEADFRRELRQSWRLVLEPKALVGSGALAVDFDQALRELCRELHSTPRRPCHRDFMARNLLLDSQQRLRVIDHQDLRQGPIWYDLGSLLNDSLYASSTEETELLAIAGVPDDERENYHRAAAQRALKIVGTFTAFAERGADRHLTLIRPSLLAAQRHLALVPETAAAICALTPSWDAKLAASW